MGHARGRRSTGLLARGSFSASSIHARASFICRRTTFARSPAKPERFHSTLKVSSSPMKANDARLTRFYESTLSKIQRSIALQRSCVVPTRRATISPHNAAGFSRFRWASPLTSRTTTRCLHTAWLCTTRSSSGAARCNLKHTIGRPRRRP